MGGLEKGTAGSLFYILSKRPLAASFKRTVRLINENFFKLQRRAFRNPGLIPVVNVDHFLDSLIPFSPKWVWIYHDFSPFWVRTAASLARRVSEVEAAGFIESVGELYPAAAKVYTRCMSTTNRPRYFGSLGCVFIQLFDPHLMCIPSLHVMVCVHTYLEAARILRTQVRRGGAPPMQEHEAQWLDKLFRRAVHITESILYMKQHSVNCIPAALYALSCIEPQLVTDAEIRRFTCALFQDERNAALSEEDRAAIRLHILSLYEEFSEYKRNMSVGSDWTAALIDFLQKRAGRFSH